MAEPEIAPVLTRGLDGGVRNIPRIVDDLIGSAGLQSCEPGFTPEGVELLGLAVNEVLHAIFGLAGEQRKRDACVELWIQPTMVILTIQYHGPMIPDWLMKNWDRGHEPAVLAPPGDIGWGWLIVREALDSISADFSGRHNVIFLERRL